MKSDKPLGLEINKGLITAKQDSLVTSIITSGKANILFIGLPLVVGSLYVLRQWYVFKSVEDAIFVSMLIAATMILLKGIKIIHSYFVNKGIDFYRFVLSSDFPGKAYQVYSDLYKEVFDSKRMLLAGVLYGILIGSSPIIFNLWEGQLLLLILLCVFLFFVNFVTGIAFFGLVKFFIRSFSLANIIKVDLWKFENPSTNFLINISRQISCLTVIYISISISSLLFSEFSFNRIVIGYSFFACITALSVLFLPLIPIARERKEEKLKALSEIDEELQKEFQEMIKEVKSSQGAVNLSRLESLLSLREKIASILIWPLRSKLLSSTLYIILISSIPVILKFFLEKFLSNWID
jgi:hypothetical protein